MVGAWRFELQTSCAQGRRSTENNRPVFNVPAETKQLSPDRSMWLAVRKCAHLSVGWAQKLAQSRVLTTVRTYYIVSGKRQNPLGKFYAKRRCELPTLCLEAVRTILPNLARGNANGTLSASWGNSEQITFSFVFRLLHHSCRCFPRFVLRFRDSAATVCQISVEHYARLSIT
jgi:hypothetical protein